ncbi:peptidylprolyl isomerase [Aequorivita antarctica]|uniref:Peptidyl-prolyl cis-trans isomerase n=1 Tax=Aequorivita antarctica TaxID=153266 RepID=A0A5C6YXA2_9FLAO|nr:peptidylprolyl isomerase [Aequorivita antarctica]TXD71830.1 T9SS type A sorting domain-containing protein [Aequorivita antarctica]SRX75406.1 Putative bifunctional phosphatase/peptidyl-prolyl cis-trans isomerase [Aequorivita antarctica]
MKKTILYFLFIIGSIGTVQSQTVVTFYTTLGDFEVELYDAQMPITVGNFLSLVDQEFYDGIIFHRVISNFVIQGGDPTGTGSGGPGYTIEDEFNPDLSNLKKTLSMANTGQPNSGGSQFFINLKDNIFLDFDNPPLSSAHPIFGEVITGWDIVELIENVPVDGNDRPITPVVMNMVRVTQPLGTNDLDATESSYTIYPNPVTKQSVIEINSKTTDMTLFSIMNVNGAILATQNIQIQEGLNRINLSDFQIDKLPVGMYFITINNNAVVTQKRFLVSE